MEAASGSRFVVRVGAGAKKIPLKQTGQVRPRLGLACAGAIRRANRAAANGRAGRRAYRVKEGPAARRSRW